MPRATLVAAASVAIVSVSPVSFFELLCHLDEEVRGSADREDSFRRQRGQILKCKALPMRCEPLEELRADLGIGGTRNPDLFYCNDLPRQLLDRLEEAQTLEAFWAAEVVRPSGKRELVRDAPARIRRVLAEEETEYREHVLEMWRAIRLVKGPDHRFHLAPLDYLGIASAQIGKVLIDLRHDGLEPELDVRAARALLPYWAFILGRALEYTQDGKCDPKALDLNDAEDGSICLHLRADRERFLVATDDGIGLAMSAGIDALCDAASGLRGAVEFRTRVIDGAEFRRRLNV